jgi:drug/metabolite transporter (DMT)-like permease
MAMAGSHNANEKLRPATLIGGGLILIAVLLLTQSELRRNRAKPQ